MYGGKIDIFGIVKKILIGRNIHLGLLLFCSCSAYMKYDSVLAFLRAAALDFMNVPH
jgi:hypothetical protein